MHPQAKKRLLYGVLILALICFGLFLYFNNSQSVIHAEKAQLQTQTYDIGASYSGEITKQFVQEGDTVEQGQKMFYIKSPVLEAQLEQSDFKKSDLQVPLTDDNNLIIEATQSGVVKLINHSQGSFVPSNSVLATIAQTKNLHVSASFSLSPDQYAKIDQHSLVTLTLPNGKAVEAPIDNITIVNEGDQVIAKITSDLSQVKYDPLTTKDGAPVNANLVVNEPLWHELYTYVADKINSLFSL